MITSVEKLATLDDAKQGRIQRGDMICDEIPGSRDGHQYGRFVGVSTTGSVWVYWASNCIRHPSTKSHEFRTLCTMFDAMEEKNAQRRSARVTTRLHDWATINAGKARRGEIVQVGTSRGIYVGRTPRGAHWIAWGSSTLKCVEFVEMCERFDKLTTNVNLQTPVAKAKRWKKTWAA